jgi:hypothetical protein
MLEFDTGIFGCELPIGLGVVEVPIAFPGGDLVDEGFDIGDATIEALCDDSTPSSDSAQIEPTAVFRGVMPVETLNQTACRRASLYKSFPGPF